MGFQTNTIYWFANWIGNVAIPIAAVGYFSYFIPALSEPWIRCIAVLGLIWLLTFANVIGPHFVTKVQTWTTSFALVPIIGIAVFGWFYFKPEVFEGAYNVSGQSNFSAISSAAALTLWAFIGVESASVTAGVVENPEKNVARATLAGVRISAIYTIGTATVAPIIGAGGLGVPIIGGLAVSNLALVLQGAVPVFADVDRDSGNITPASIEAVITERTKAIIVVHLAG